jgi:hypothetical protein
LRRDADVTRRLISMSTKIDAATTIISPHRAGAKGAEHLETFVRLTAKRRVPRRPATLRRPRAGRVPALRHPGARPAVCAHSTIQESRPGRTPRD